MPIYFGDFTLMQAAAAEMHGLLGFFHSSLFFHLTQQNLMDVLPTEYHINCLTD